MKFQKEKVIRLLAKYRRALGAPRRNFSKNLRKKVLHRFVRSEQFFGESLRHTVHISVSKDFRVRLRNELLAEAPTPSRFSFKNPFTLYFGRIAFPVIASFLLFFSAIFLDASPQSRASDNTLITSFFGEIYLTPLDKEETLLYSEVSLMEGAVLRTGDSSGVTLRFFEDSIVRMDKNTRISIETLRPYPTQSDLGEVQVRLHSGRVWIKSFSLNDEFSQFHLLLPKNKISLNMGAAVDASVFGSHEIIRSWDRSARVQGEHEGGVILLGGRQLHQQVRGTSIETISEKERSSLWTLSNMASDEQRNTYFIEEKMQRKKKEATSTFVKIKETFVSSLSHAEEKDILKLETLFFDSLSRLSTQFDKPNQDFFQEFRKNTQSLFLDHPEAVEIFLSSAEKNLYSILPDSPFYIAKQTVETLQNEFAQEQEQFLLAEKNRTRRLWEASLLVNTGKFVLAEEVLRQNTESIEAENNISGEDVADLLLERQKQITALGQIENINFEDVVHIAEEDLIQNTSALVRPGFPKKSNKMLNDTNRAHAIIGRVKLYKSQRGQENSLRTQIGNIDNIAENISLLLEVKNRLPDSIQAEVDQKIMLILHEEQIKAKDKSMFRIEK